MRYSQPVFLVLLITLIVFLAPRAFASPVAVSITPTTQAVPQGTSVSYSISLSGGAATSFSLDVSGLYGSGSFSPNPVSTPAGSGTATLTVGTTGAPGLYCPGVYPFTVTATNATDGPLPSPPGAQNPEAGSATGTLTVVQVGPPLAVTVSTDKSTYIVGDTVTITISANRPAEGRLTISSPTGTPSVFNYQLLYGSYSLTKTLTASSIGQWTLSFQADDFCGFGSSAQVSFTVSPNTYDVSLSLNGVPPQYSASVLVDGQSQGSIGGGQIQKLTFTLNTSHSITVEQYVTGEQGVRYYCAQNTLTVTSTGSFTFSYQTQYEFTVQTDPSGVTPVTGGGWYPSGTTVQTNQAPQTVAGGTGTQYAFKGWLLNGAPSTGNPVSVTMNQPYTATAKYATQYQLVVNSVYGNPQGTGYYDSGTTAQFSVSTPVGFPIQQIFVQWQGDYTGTSPQGSLVMNKPHVVTAVWSTSYIPLIAIIIIAAAIVGGLLLWRRRGKPPPETKPTPTSETATGGAGATAQALKCGKCGSENPADQKFCTNCGESLAQP